MILTSKPLGYGIIFGASFIIDREFTMKIGINKISFYIPKYYLPLATLAKARDVDPLKYTNGLKQNKMAVAPSNQDAVSMAANAALQIITENDIADIDLVIFATETANDNSKSAATYLLSLLGLRTDVRAIELKQACYAVTAGLYFAKGHILQHPNAKVLVVGSDIARYGINSDGEATQGAGAVAIIVSKNPKILVLNDYYGVHAEDIYDFWRPNGMDYALVDGHYSNEQYKKFFLETFSTYLDRAKQSIDDFSAITFHIPYSKIGLRSLQLIANVGSHPKLFENYEHATTYSKEVGNIYTGSLFLSLTSLLENGKLKAKDQIGLYSYGSGAVAEFFSGTVVAGYKKHLEKKLHKELIKNRIKLKIGEYEEMIANTLKSDIELPMDDSVKVQLGSIKNSQRLYTKKDVI